MRVSLKSVLAAGLLLGVVGTASADLLVQSVVDQSGFLGRQTIDGTVGMGGHLYDLATYDFTTAATTSSYLTTDLATNVFPTYKYSNLTSIDTLTVSLTALDPDSGPTEWANNNLILVLDGINTGVKLNASADGLVIATITVTDNPAVGAAILSALQTDGKLVAQVLDLSPAVGATDPDLPDDLIGFSSSLTTSLDLTGKFASNGPSPIPLPAALLLAPLGACIAGAYARRFRKA